MRYCSTQPPTAGIRPLRSRARPPRKRWRNIARRKHKVPRVFASASSAMQFNGTLYQIAVVTRNLEAGGESYSRRLGLPGWKQKDTHSPAPYRDCTGRIANRNAFAPWGAIHLEMIEPSIGEGNAKEW